MSWLAELKRIKNTPAPTLQKLQNGLSVVSVGELRASNENINREDKLHAARLQLLTARGLDLVKATSTADRLRLRDAKHDDRRLCLECRHLSIVNKVKHCGQWRKLGLSTPLASPDLINILQRCNGYEEKLALVNSS